MRLFAAALLGLSLCAGVAAKDKRDKEEDMATVEVDGLRNPQMKSYRAVWAGLDAFDNERALAPAVPQLRFRIGTKDDKYVTERDITLRIASDDLTIPVPVTTEGSFIVPRSRAAFDAGADLIFNRRTGQYQVAPEVRTPGLPENMRRLGDLRLECKVAVAIVKEEIPGWVVLLANVVLLTNDWCMTTKGDVEFSYPTERPVTGAVLAYGDRRLRLKMNGRDYKVPLADRSWPDEAMVLLEFAQQ